MDDHDEGADLIEVGTLDDIPTFTSEAEEAEWWSSHELSEELWQQHGQWVDDKLILVMPMQKVKRRAGPAGQSRGEA